MNVMGCLMGRPRNPVDKDRCTAHNKRGGRCGRYAVPGGTVCHLHGGVQQKLAGQRRCDPKVGGRPPKHGLYAKRVMDSVIDIYDEGAKTQLLEELRVARANLAFALSKQKEDPMGGVLISDNKIRPWSEIVRLHLETVRRLAEAHARINLIDPSGDGTEGPRVIEWETIAGVGIDDVISKLDDSDA